MTHPDDVPCPECGRPFGIHTLTEYREHTATRLPFEEIPDPMPTTSSGAIIVDHLDVAALVIQFDTAAGTMHLPGVEFRFHSSAPGPQPPPIVFTADNPGMFKELGRLIVGACGAAPMRARQADRRG